MVSSDTEDAVGYLVKRVQQSLRRRCDAALRPTGLSMAQYAALRALADHPDASASELARLCFVTRQSLQDLLTGMRSAGLVADADARRGGGRNLDDLPGSGGPDWRRPTLRWSTSKLRWSRASASSPDRIGRGTDAVCREPRDALTYCRAPVGGSTGTTGMASSGSSAQTANATG